MYRLERGHVRRHATPIDFPLQVSISRYMYIERGTFTQNNNIVFPLWYFASVSLDIDRTGISSFIFETSRLSTFYVLPYEMKMELHVSIFFECHDLSRGSFHLHMRQHLVATALRIDEYH